MIADHNQTGKTQNLDTRTETPPIEAHTIMSATFKYRSVMDAQLNEEEARHNLRDPSGKAAKVIMPAKRERARLDLPKFYDPSQQ